jgi:putative endonuclease
MPYYSYVIRSLKNEMLYKGSTQNIQNRLQYHNLGKVTFTSKFTPWELVLSESFNTRAEATKREKWYKTGVGREWINQQL